MLVSLDPVLGWIIAAAGAALFGEAAWHKRRRRDFALILDAYALAPAALNAALASALPLAEGAVAAGLLFERTRRWAALGGCALLLLYAAAIAINLRRGRRHLDCGCAAPGERRPIAPWMLWRNGLVALALGVQTLPWAPRSLGATDLLTVLAGLGVAVMLHASMDRLLASPRGASSSAPVQQPRGAA